MLNQILSFAKCLLDYTLFWWLFSFFFERKHSWPWDVTTLVSLSALLQYINTLYVPWLNTASGFIIGLGIAFILFRGTIVQICICVSMAVLALLVSEFVPIAFSALIIEDNLVDVMNHTIYNASFNLIGTGIFFCIILLIRLVSQKKRISLTTNYFTLCVPFLSVFIIYFMLYSSRYLPSDKKTYTFFAALYTAIILTNIFLILGERNVERRIALEKELLDLSYKEELSKALIEQQTNYIEELNEIRHDFKRQLMGLYALSETTSSVAVPSEYVDEMLESVDNIRSFDYIESLPLRVIINSAYNKCLHFGIEFISDIRFSNFDFMTYPDVYSFFDNAFQNSIEACNAIEDPNVKKYVSVKIIRKGDMVYVQICNPYCGKLTPSLHGFFSTKLNNIGHGFGTKNIWKIATKYGGTITYKTKDDYELTCLFSSVLSK